MGGRTAERSNGACRAQRAAAPIGATPRALGSVHPAAAALPGSVSAAPASCDSCPLPALLPSAPSCSCVPEELVLDGHWDQKLSLPQFQAFKVGAGACSRSPCFGVSGCLYMCHPLWGTHAWFDVSSCYVVR